MTEVKAAPRKVGRLRFSKGWAERPPGGPPDEGPWKLVPIWKRMLDRELRAELQHLLAGRPLHGRGPVRMLPQPAHKRESQRQMRKLMDFIVDTGLVRVPQRSGCFNSISLREGADTMVGDFLKQNEELAYCVTKWWENLVEESANPQPHDPTVGITKDVYVWCVARLMTFLMIYPEGGSAGRQTIVDETKAVGEYDWLYDSHRRRVVQFSAFFDMLLDLSTLWCDVNVTSNVGERVAFLSTLYDHVFFDRLPGWTPALVVHRVEQRIMARTAPLSITAYELFEAQPSSPRSPATPSSAREESRDETRRYEEILQSLQYEPPPSYDHHNVYDSFPARRVRPVTGRRGGPTAAAPGDPPASPPLSPREEAQRKQMRLVSYSKMLASVIAPPSSGGNSPKKLPPATPGKVNLVSPSPAWKGPAPPSQLP
eukprot:EG_transcript_13702